MRPGAGGTMSEPGKADDEIARHRAELDAIDRKVVALLNERAAHALAIGKLKGGGPVYRPEREAEVLRNVAAGATGALPDAALVRIYTEVISACRAIEAQVTVAYLGPQGTFT